MVKKVLVTGGSGKAGRFVLQELLDHGYDVTNVDLVSSKLAPTFKVDLCDLGQVFGVVDGKDAILHLAAIPWAGEHAPEYVFRNNVMSSFNIFQAAAVLGVKNIVMAGSESILGFPFAYQPITPQYIPIDEDHPLLAQDAYGIGKIVVEEVAQGFTRRDPKLSITSLRLSYVIPPEDLVNELRDAWVDPPRNGFNLWCYVDARDVASAFRLAMETPQPGFGAYYIGAPDNFMRQPSMDLLNRYYPGVSRIAPGFGGREAPLSSRKAEERFGWKAQYLWMDVLTPAERAELEKIPLW